MNRVLADTQILHALYKKHHWLMRGATFSQLHLFTAAALIALLDEERTLKRLVEHHHEREETALFTEVFAAHAAPSLA